MELKGFTGMSNKDHTKSKFKRYTKSMASTKLGWKFWDCPNPGGEISIGRFNSSVGDATGAGCSGSGGTGSDGGLSGGSAMGEQYQDRCDLFQDALLYYKQNAYGYYGVDDYIDCDFPFLSEDFKLALKNYIESDGRILDEGVVDFIKDAGLAGLNIASGAIVKLRDKYSIINTIFYALKDTRKNKEPVIFIVDNALPLSLDQIEKDIKTFAPTSLVFNFYLTFANDDIDSNLYRKYRPDSTLIKGLHYIWGGDVKGFINYFNKDDIYEVDLKSAYEKSYDSNRDHIVTDTEFNVTPTADFMYKTFIAAYYEQKDEYKKAANDLIVSIINYIKDNKIKGTNSYDNDLLLLMVKDRLTGKIDRYLSDKYSVNDVSRSVNDAIRYHKRLVFTYSSSDINRLSKEFLNLCVTVDLRKYKDAPRWMGGTKFELVSSKNRDHSFYDPSKCRPQNLSGNNISNEDGRDAPADDRSNNSNSSKTNGGINTKSTSGRTRSSYGNAIVPEVELESLKNMKGLSMLKYFNDLNEDLDEFDDEEEIIHQYDPQIDYILNDLDKNLQWLVQDGICSKPLIDDNMITLNCDPELEIMNEVKSILLRICSNTNAKVNDDGCVFTISFTKDSEPDDELYRIYNDDDCDYDPENNYTYDADEAISDEDNNLDLCLDLSDSNLSENDYKALRECLNRMNINDFYGYSDPSNFYLNEAGAIYKLDRNTFQEALTGEKMTLSEAVNAIMSGADLGFVYNFNGSILNEGYGDVTYTFPYKPSNEVLNKLESRRLSSGRQINVKAITSLAKLYTYYHAALILKWGWLKSLIEEVVDEHSGKVQGDPKELSDIVNYYNRLNPGSEVNSNDQICNVDSYDEDKQPSFEDEDYYDDLEDMNDIIDTNIEDEF